MVAQFSTGILAQFSISIYITDTGEQQEVPDSDGEYHYWESDDWYYIDRKGQRIE